MLLRVGITGFWDKKETVPPLTDLKMFKETCHVAMLQCGGKVLEIQEAYSNSSKNYHLAYLKQKHEVDAVILYLNAHYPFLAVKTAAWEKERSCEKASSRSWQKASKVFKNENIVYHFQQEYRFLSPTELEEPLNFSHIKKDKRVHQLGNENDLAEVELEMIHSWQRTLSSPLTIGDIIFNWWD